MLIFKPKTKRYRISVDIAASGNITLEKEFPEKRGPMSVVQAWTMICEELSRLHEVTGIEFEAVPKTLKVEELADGNEMDKGAAHGTRVVLLSAN